MKTGGSSLLVNRLLIDWSPFTKKRIEIERYIHRFIKNFVNQERITIIFTIEMIEMVDFNIAHAQIIEINHFKSTQLYGFLSTTELTIPSRTIVLQAWVSSVVCRLSCRLSSVVTYFTSSDQEWLRKTYFSTSVVCRVSNLKDGIFSKRFELEG